MLSFSKYIYYRQLQEMDCGPTCLKIIAACYGKVFAIGYLRNLTNVTRSGANINDIADAAQTIGFETLLLKTNIDYLKKDRPFPIVLHWRQNHFVVLHQINRNNDYIIADPKVGIIKLKEDEFLLDWQQSEKKGIALILEPRAEFFSTDISKHAHHNNYLESWRFLTHTLSDHKRKVYAIVTCLLAGTVTAYLFPLAMRRLIDAGLQGKNIHIIYSVLLFQLILFLGDIVTECLRSIILVHLSMQISIKVIREFLHKLILLPIQYFDTKTHADIYQRIEDQNNIQSFLTTKVIQFSFSFILIIALSCQLAFFNFTVFLIFVCVSALSIGWVLFFYNKRAYLNYSKFGLASSNRNNITELISGMPEVKINNAQHVRIAIWERIQHQLYKLELRALHLSQYQLLVVKCLSQLKSLSITAICAFAVFNHEISLGTMLSIGYIVGQLKTPLDQMVDFLWTGQDAKISFDRLHEIQKKDNESNSDQLVLSSDQRGDLVLKNVSFKYPGSSNATILDNISLRIADSKITAIVGASGSGKTTLMKMLLKFYNPIEGDLFIGEESMSHVNPDSWRKKCGVVMQDGYIYSSTIAENIALADNSPDETRLIEACRIACIDEFILSLPLGFQTKIGKSGTELSGGQRQRILIARAVYANPQYLFFDEATSALDANNEYRIIENLQQFFLGRTVVIIAHRLSTVKNAHHIVVLKDKQVAETGNHQLLADKRGIYFDLVRNQLELGS